MCVCVYARPIVGPLLGSLLDHLSLGSSAHYYTSISGDATLHIRLGGRHIQVGSLREAGARVCVCVCVGGRLGSASCVCVCVCVRVWGCLLLLLLLPPCLGMPAETIRLQAGLWGGTHTHTHTHTHSV